jgi:hypothetical protein
MAKSKLLKAGAKKLTKKSGIKKTVKKTGMKKAPNFDKFKQTRGFPTEGKYAMTKAAKKPGFKTGAASGVAATYAAQKGLGTKKSKAKESTKRMADDAYKKQKEKQKKYYDKKTESKRK